MITSIIQGAILLLSGLAFWISTATKPHRAGYIIGMLAQPLWIFDTWQHDQWGMFLLSWCFFIGYARGWWRSIAPRRNPQIPPKPMPDRPPKRIFVFEDLPTDQEDQERVEQLEQTHYTQEMETWHQSTR